MTAPWTSLTAIERAELAGGRARRALPALVTVLTALLVTAPVFGPGASVPHLPLLMVVVWRLYQPALMPPWAALVAGVIADLALALPLGVNATALPAAAMALRVLRQRFGHRPFLLDWLLALPFLALALLLGWQLTGLAGHPRDPAGLLPQLLTTWALFPAVARASAWGYRRIIA